MAGYTRERLEADRARIRNADSVRMSIGSAAFLVLASPILAGLEARIHDNVDYIAQVGFRTWAQTPQYETPHPRSFRVGTLATAMIADNTRGTDYLLDYVRFTPTLLATGFTGDLEKCITDRDEIDTRGASIYTVRERADCLAQITGISEETLRTAD